MSTPRYIQSKWIKTVPESDAGDKVRPGVDGKWVAPANSKPKIIVKLVDSGEPGIPVGKIEVNGNFDKFTVEYKKEARPDAQFEPLTFLNDGEPQVS